MKKKVYYALACVLSLTGCNHSSLEEVIPETTVIPVQFSIQMEKEILSFPAATRSMPGNTIPEPSASKAAEGDAELHELCTTIEYVVFNNEETPTLLKHKQFTYDPLDLDADFNCIYDSLPQGNYKFCFLGHNSNTATLTGSTFSFDTLSDTFFETISLNISVAETINQDVTLQRIVGRIEFMATDPVTEQLKQFDMEVEGISDGFDIIAGQGVKAAEKQVFTHLFTAEEIGKVNNIHSFYTFIPATDNQLVAHLTAIAQNDEPLRERQVNNITPERNKIIRYKGRLYSRSESDDTFQISIYNNGEWEDITDVELPDYE